MFDKSESDVFEIRNPMEADLSWLRHIRTEHVVIDTVCVWCAACVTAEVETEGDVVGVTSVSDELFVMQRQHIKQVAVYSTINYQLLRRLHLPKFRPLMSNDITSCMTHRRLYMSDSEHSCIYRCELSGHAVRKWKVCGSPCGLSISRSCNLLVVCRCESDKLLELNAGSGDCVREIALPSDIESPSRAVELTTGQYVICHGYFHNNTLHRVCIIDDDGQITRSYGSQPGSGVGCLDFPHHVAVDKDSQFIFVADCGNDRIVVLSPTLEFVNCISEKLTWPHRLHIDHVSRRIYVGQQQGNVAVIQL